MRKWFAGELEKVNWKRVWLAVMILTAVILFGGTAVAAYILGA